MSVELLIHRAMMQRPPETIRAEWEFLEYNSEMANAVEPKADLKIVIWDNVKKAFEFLECCG
jgi:hypothetical protein